VQIIKQQHQKLLL